MHFAKMKLKGQARIWWRNVEARINRLSQASIIHWEEMKLKLQERFLPLDYGESLFEELQNLNHFSVKRFGSHSREFPMKKIILASKQKTNDLNLTIANTNFK